MNNQSWEETVKAINAQNRYERLLIISKELYKALFDYQNPCYRWTCNEYGELFKTLNELSKEYDSRDWRASSLLDDHYKTRPIVEKASVEWMNVQAGKA